MLFEKINDIAYAIVTETAKAVQIAHAMIADAELTARAEAEAQHHTNCRNCQAGMVNWRIVNPTADETKTEEAHEDIWSQCPVCVDEYKAWCEEVDRKAEEAELARLGDGYHHAVNGDDHRWQNGGGK